MNQEYQQANQEERPVESRATEDAAPNLIQRVVMVFSAPTRLGTVLRGRSPWFWTLAIVAIVGLIIVLITPDELFRQAVEAQRAGRPQPEGQAQPALSTLRYIGAASGLAGAFIAAAVIAGVLYLVFNVIFGQSEITYKQHLSAVAHSWWILMLGSILTFLLMLAKGDGTVKLGFGLLLAEAPSSFFGHLLNGITLFGLWTAATLGFVESGLTGGKTTGGKGASAIIVLYLLFVALVAAFQGIAGRG